jgi:hypothetical protein
MKMRRTANTRNVPARAGKAPVAAPVAWRDRPRAWRDQHLYSLFSSLGRLAVHRADLRERIRLSGAHLGEAVEQFAPRRVVTRLRRRRAYPRVHDRIRRAPKPSDGDIANAPSSTISASRSRARFSQDDPLRQRQQALHVRA